MINIKEIYDNIEDSYMEITKKYIAISEHNFQEAMGNHPSTFAFFAGVMAYAKKEVDRSNLIFETREAEVREARREELRQAGQKTTDQPGVVCLQMLVGQPHCLGHRTLGVGKKNVK